MSEALAELGPYFAVSFHDPAREPEAPWRSLTELVDDPVAMAERVEAVRAFLAAGGGQDPDAVEPRVAASVVHLGLAARVVSPLFAVAVVLGPRGGVRAVDLRWQPGLASTFPLSIAEVVLDHDRQLTDGVIIELASAIAPFGVNQHILRGNVASALAGAAKALSAARPDLAREASATLEALLTGPDLAGSATSAPDGSFRRRSCCLIYRAAPCHDGALCGDCVLAQTGRVRAA